MSTVAELVVRIGANIGNFEKGVTNAQNKIKNFGEGLSKTGKKLTNWITLPAIATTTALVGLGSQVSKEADRIDKMSQSLGLSRQGFQAWDFILSQSGASIDSMGAGLKTLDQRILEASQGAGKGAELFEELGVSVTDSNGQLRNKEDVLADVVRSMQKLDDGTQKNILANDAFGRSGQDLLPLLNGQEGALDELLGTYDNLNIAMSDEMIDSGVRFQDLMDQVGRQVKSVGLLIAEEVLPIMEKFAIWFRDEGIEHVRDFIGWVKGLIQQFKNLSPETQKFIGVAVATAIALGPILVLFGKIAMGISSVIGVVKILIPLVTGLFKVFSTIITVGKLLIPIIAGISLPMLAVIAVIGALIAIGVMLWKNWDTVRAKGIQIFNSIGTFFQNFANKVASIFNGIANKIVSTFNGIRSGIKNSINSIIDIINSGINSLNRFGFSIPSKIAGIPIPVIGGASLNINIPRIPRLADGGIVMRETLAIVGERGPEAVIPLDQMGGMGGITIHVEQLVVREDADVERIAEKLFRLQENKLRGKGRGGRL